MSIIGYTKDGADAAFAGAPPSGTADGTVAVVQGGSYVPVAQIPVGAVPDLSGSYAAVVKAATGVLATDTATLNAAITAAAGGRIRVPAGTYVLENVQVTGKAHLVLDEGAVLQHRAGATLPMLKLSGTSLRVEGGTLDGNQQNQTNRFLDLINGAVGYGSRIVVKNADVINGQRSLAYMTNFGGFASFEGCKFTGQAEHDGTLGHETFTVAVESGQEAPAATGFIRYSKNRHYGTTTPAIPGGSPGGLFVAVNGYDATGGGLPGSDGFANGNMSTVEAIGNYFYGYGQDAGGNDIGPLHFYPSTRGVRIIGNYFYGCGFSAIAAKSVEDFICDDNIILNGQTSSGNTSSEGAISYVPGYQAGALSRPRATLTGNIIINPGGQASDNQQACINIGGTATSLATDVICSTNVMAGGGIGIRIDRVINATLADNQIYGGTTSSTHIDHGISITNATGDVLIRGGRIECSNGHGVLANQGNSAATICMDGVTVTQDSASYYGAALLGVGTAKFTGCNFRAAGTAVRVATDGTNNVGLLAWDESNTVLTGAISITWANVTAARGQLVSTNTPVGNVTPAVAGTTYRQTNGTGAGILWVALGTTSSTWTELLATSAGAAAVNNLLGWAYDGSFAVAANTIAGAGVLEVVRVPLLGGGSLSKVFFQVSGAGSGLTAGECFIGVYDDNGNLIGQSADLSTTLASAGNKTVSLTAATTTLTPGAFVDVALLWNGTTGPTIRGINGTGMLNLGLTAVADYRYATAGSGLTALPATLPTKAAATTEPWFGVN